MTMMTLTERRNILDWAKSRSKQPPQPQPIKPTPTRLSGAEKLERNRIRMRVKRYGRNVRIYREWPELAGLCGQAREMERKRILRREETPFHNTRQKWPQLAGLSRVEYKHQYKRLFRLRERQQAEQAFLTHENQVN